MPRATISAQERIQIVTLMQQGLRQVDIAAIVHVSQSDVSRICSKFRHTHSIADRLRTGRPHATIHREDQYLHLTARRRPYSRASELRRGLQAATECNVSNQTNRNRLHDVGLRSRRPIRAPVLSRQHRVARMRWARLHRNWTREQWDHTLFCDETRICLYPDDRSVRVWRRSGEPVHQRRSSLRWRKCHVLGRHHVWPPYATYPYQRCNDRCILQKQHSCTHCERLC